MKQQPTKAGYDHLLNIARSNRSNDGKIQRFGAMVVGGIVYHLTHDEMSLLRLLACWL